MSSRNKILETIKKNQPASTPLPNDVPHPGAFPDLLTTFEATLTKIGGVAVRINQRSEITTYVQQHFADAQRIVCRVPEVTGFSTTLQDDPHLLEDVTLAILAGEIGVAESGATWITEPFMGDRALPFISEHLALVIRQDQIVPTLQQAYESIGCSPHAFGTFIAGPSKTADIEQSLVLGAHGPKSLVVFIVMT